MYECKTEITRRADEGHHLKVKLTVSQNLHFFKNKHFINKYK